jgi:hypothetical protein
LKSEKVFSLQKKNSPLSSNQKNDGKKKRDLVQAGTPVNKVQTYEKRFLSSMS